MAEDEVTKRWIVNAHGYDSPYMAKVFIEREDGSPVCGLWANDPKLSNLIAASPELLSAARSALEFLRTLKWDGDEVKQLEAAIKRVDGGV